jgi:hypothetical protein
MSLADHLFKSADTRTDPSRSGICRAALTPLQQSESAYDDPAVKISGQIASYRSEYSGHRRGVSNGRG